MTLLNGLTVVLVPRPPVPFGHRAARIPRRLGGAAAGRARAGADRRGSGRTGPAGQQDGGRPGLDGRGFTADFVRTDRRRLSNALKLLAERLKTVAETDWPACWRAPSRPPGRRGPETHDDPRTVAAGRMQAALYGAPSLRQAAAPGRTCWSWIRRWRPVASAALQSAERRPRHRRRHRRRCRGLAGVGVVRGLAGQARRRPPDGAPGAAAGGRPTREPVLITHRPVASQVEVVFACRLASPTTGRERAAQRVLAGLLGAELTTEIREKAGATYSVSGGAAALPAGGAHLAVSMSVDTRRLRDALRVLHAELDDLGGRPDRQGRGQPDPVGAGGRRRARLPDGRQHRGTDPARVHRSRLPLADAGDRCRRAGAGERAGRGPRVRPLRLVARAVAGRRRADDPRRDVAVGRIFIIADVCLV